jgi:hypothetical protein
MSDKFKNCFIDALPDYEYDIEYEGDLIARGKSLSAKDKSFIEKQAMKKSFVNGELEIEIDANAMKTAYIIAGLKEWKLPRKLDSESVSMLTEELRDVLFNAIQEHENSAAKAVEDNEKN